MSFAGLEVVGRLPSWLQGGYLRNGPGSFDGGHLFDGLALLARFDIGGDGPPRLKTRFLESVARKEFVRTGRRVFGEFGTPLGPLGFLRSLRFGGPVTDNAVVSVAKVGEAYVAATETAAFEIDGESLRTLGPFRRVDDKGKNTQIRTAHPERHGSGFVNVATDVLRNRYDVLTFDSHLGRPVKVASIKSRRRFDVAWVHAFAVTASGKVVFFETPAVYDLRSLLGGAVKFKWRPDRRTWIHVVDLNLNQETSQATFEAPANFFTFHCANAFESRDGNIHVDVCAYEDSSIVDGLRLANMRNASYDVPSSTLSRLSINLTSSHTTTTVERLDDHDGDFAEFADVNPKFKGSDYSFAYALGAQRPTSAANVVTKTNVRLRKTTTLKSALNYAAFSEPTFVPTPDATTEDDGVVLSVGHRADTGEAHLLVFDARTCTELARVVVPSPGIPYGFHGIWDPSPSSKSSSSSSSSSS